MQPKKTHLTIHIVFFTMLLLSSCANVDDIRLTGVDNVKLHGIENSKVTFTADIGIANPSTIGFKIREVDLKTTVDGIYIGTLTVNDKLRIKPRSDSSYTTDFTLQMANLLTSAGTLYGITRKKQVTVEMQGYVKARSWFAYRKIDVSEKRLIDVPSMTR